MNNPNLSDMINDDDEGVLQYLFNVVVSEYEEVKSGYKITFVSLSINKSTMFVYILLLVAMGTVRWYTLCLFWRDRVTLCTHMCVWWEGFDLFLLTLLFRFCCWPMLVLILCTVILLLYPHSTLNPILTSPTTYYPKRLWWRALGKQTSKELRSNGNPDEYESLLLFICAKQCTWYFPFVCCLLFSCQDLTAPKELSPDEKGRKRPLEEAPSFFQWFSETDSTSDPIAEIIKDDIWPSPFQFFVVSLLP